MKKPQWRSRREARKYGGWRNKRTRLADFGMVEYCQLVRRLLSKDGQDVEGKIKIDRALWSEGCFLSEGQEEEKKIQII